jgi:hypothetical protein
MREEANANELELASKVREMLSLLNKLNDGKYALEEMLSALLAVTAEILSYVPPEHRKSYIETAHTVLDADLDLRFEHAAKQRRELH